MKRVGIIENQMKKLRGVIALQARIPECGSIKTELFMKKFHLGIVALLLGSSLAFAGKATKRNGQLFTPDAGSANGWKAVNGALGSGYTCSQNDEVICTRELDEQNQAIPNSGRNGMYSELQ